MTNEELTEMLRDVCRQRDEARKALGDLVDRFWSAHYNHAFDAEDKTQTKVTCPDGTEKTGEYMCSAGKSLRDVFRGCSLYDTDKCRGHDCAMGFHHRLMYESVRKANEVLECRRAELKPFDYSRIPPFDEEQGSSYDFTSRWYARMLLCFLNSFRVDEKLTKERAAEAQSALYRLLRIGLSKYGLSFPTEKEITRYESMKDESGLTQEERARLEGIGKSIAEFFAAKGTRFEGKLGPNGDAGGDLTKLLAGDEEFACRWLVSQVFIIVHDYNVGGDYPGCDLGVYAEAFGEIKHHCALVMKMLDTTELDIAMNLNDTTLDWEGLSDTRRKQEQ